jgi:carbon-monoxide dehydrogenase iron sulfur subunit
MPFRDENNPKILIDLEKCTGCLNCQLICSFTYHEVFNPDLAQIKIERTINDEKGARFTDECIQCSICADYCVYGALTRTEVD